MFCKKKIKYISFVLLYIPFNLEVDGKLRLKM